MSVRLRLVLGAISAVLLVAVSACGGSDSKNTASGSPTNPSTRLGTPGAPVTDVTVHCAEFEGVAQKIAEAETKLYSGSGAEDALSALLAELEALKDGAPSDVKAALDDLASAFTSAKSELSTPTQAGADALKELGTRLSADGQKITAYVISKCTS